MVNNHSKKGVRKRRRTTDWETISAKDTSVKGLCFSPFSVAVAKYLTFDNLYKKKV